jgi:hypothetical protein
MVSRVLALLTLLATVALLSDVAQILCFGEDGHVAFERLVSDEHVRTAVPSAKDDETIVPTPHASPLGVHIDVSVGDVGLKNRISTQTAPATSGAHVTLPIAYAPVLAGLVLDVETPTLCALRTTVLRT